MKGKEKGKGGEDRGEIEEGRFFYFFFFFDILLFWREGGIWCVEEKGEEGGGGWEKPSWWRKRGINHSEPSAKIEIREGGKEEGYRGYRVHRKKSYKIT